jgi:hypothetical protein
VPAQQWELALAEAEAEEGLEEEEEEDADDQDEDEGGSEGAKYVGPLQRLRKLKTSLTRLVLGSIEASRSGCITGPGLAVVACLTRLQQLKLSNLEALDGPAWHEHPLPLPASLRKLEVEGVELQPDARGALQDAADLQGFAFRVGEWV